MSYYLVGLPASYLAGCALILWATSRAFRRPDLRASAVKTTTFCLLAGSVLAFLAFATSVNSVGTPAEEPWSRVFEFTMIAAPIFSTLLGTATAVALNRKQVARFDPRRRLRTEVE